MLSLADVFTPAGLAALGQVLMIDLMLAGDNVVVLGALAAGLPVGDRRKVLAIGAGIALVFLSVFAWFATRLLHVVGLLLQISDRTEDAIQCLILLMHELQLSLLLELRIVVFVLERIRIR